MPTFNEPTNSTSHPTPIQLLPIFSQADLGQQRATRLTEAVHVSVAEDCVAVALADAVGLTEAVVVVEGLPLGEGERDKLAVRVAVGLGVAGRVGDGVRERVWDWEGLKGPVTVGVPANCLGAWDWETTKYTKYYT